MKKKTFELKEIEKKKNKNHTFKQVWTMGSWVARPENCHEKKN